MASPIQPVAPPEQRHKTSFFDLPRELRDEIYSLALDTGPHNISHPRHDRLERNFKFPTLAQVNRQLRNEASETWYSISTFKFQSSFDIVDLSNLVGGDNIAMVRHLHPLRLPAKAGFAQAWVACYQDALEKNGVVLREGALEVKW